MVEARTVFKFLRALAGQVNQAKNKFDLSADAAGVEFVTAACDAVDSSGDASEDDSELVQVVGQ